MKHEPIYVQDGNVFTSAGGTTSKDLAWAMIADDFGARHDWCKLMVQCSKPAPVPQFASAPAAG